MTFPPLQASETQEISHRKSQANTMRWDKD